MSSLKLKRFPATAHTRLGDLLRKDKSATLTEKEEDEMLDLLRTATKVSTANATLLRTIRCNAPTKRESAHQRPRFALNQ